MACLVAKQPHWWLIWSAYPLRDCFFFVQLPLDVEPCTKSTGVCQRMHALRFGKSSTGFIVPPMRSQHPKAYIRSHSSHSHSRLLQSFHLCSDIATKMQIHAEEQYSRALMRLAVNVNKNQMSRHEQDKCMLLCYRVFPHGCKSTRMQVDPSLK